MKKQSKWSCDWCNKSFKLKRTLVEHLMDELNDASEHEMTTYYQLDELGVDPYKPEELNK